MEIAVIAVDEESQCFKYMIVHDLDTFVGPMIPQGLKSLYAALLQHIATFFTNNSI